MKKLTLCLVGLSLTGFFTCSQILAQNTSNPGNGGSSYGTGESGSYNTPSPGHLPSAADLTKTNSPSAQTVYKGSSPAEAQPADKTAIENSNNSETDVSGGKGVLRAPTPVTVPPGPNTPNYSSTLPENGGVPPTVTAKAPPKDLGYSSTLPENGGAPPTVTAKSPLKDLGYSSTLPGNGGVPPVISTNAPSHSLGYSSTLPGNGGTPPTVTAKSPSKDLGYSSTLPESGATPPVVAPKNPENAPTYPPTAPH